MVRDVLATVALHAEVVGALRRARVLVAREPHAIEAMTAHVQGCSSDGEYARRVGRAVSRSARFVPRSTCLIAAVAGYEVLARRGIRGTLCLGHDALPGANFVAHAWLELNGQAVVGLPSSRRFAR